MWRLCTVGLAQFKYALTLERRFMALCCSFSSEFEGSSRSKETSFT